MAEFEQNIDGKQVAQLLNWILHKVTTDPLSPNDAQFWYRTDSDRMKVRTSGGTEDVAFLSDVSGSGISGTLFDAQTILAAVTDDNPLPLTVAEQTLVGRITGGDIAALTAAQIRILLNVENGATADLSAAEILALLLTVDGSGTGLDADTLDGQQASEFATQADLLNVQQGFDWKDGVVAATTSNIALTGLQTIDGVSLIDAQRVLVKDQSSPADNGIYTASSSTWFRATDADTAIDIQNATVFVEQGTVNEGTAWNLTTDFITLGVTGLTFAQFGAGATYTAGAGLDLSGNVFSIPADGVTDAMLTSDNFVKKYSETIGNGALTDIAVAHGLGTRDVTTVVYRNQSPYDQVFPDVDHTNTTTTTFSFLTAPTTNQYRVVITG